VIMEPLADVVFAVAPTDVSITATDTLFDEAMLRRLERARELVRGSPATALAFIAAEIERTWPSSVAR
jgi:hypothetical protein